MFNFLKGNNEVVPYTFSPLRTQSTQCIPFQPPSFTSSMASLHPAPSGPPPAARVATNVNESCFRRLVRRTDEHMTTTLKRNLKLVDLDAHPCVVTAIDFVNRQANLAVLSVMIDHT